MASVNENFSVPEPPMEPERLPTPPPQHLPEPPPIVLDPLPEEPAPDQEPMLPAESWVWKSIHTTVNAFGLLLDYPSIPMYNPDAVLTLEEMADIPGGTRSNTATLPSTLTPFEPDDPDEPAPSASVPSL
ncbi:hypothetical protein B0H10DRAFT_1951638 [Mycena sp. CBHHK59/15]|nr:hypothetical protein B0H10DRAFT_1951638 [Mycena sp. CBHHK59/15]